MKKKVMIKKVMGNVVITDDETYTISKFARYIPELMEGREYEIEIDDRNFLYSAELINGENKIKGLLIIDFETSGVDVNKHYPLSVGMIKTDNNLQIQDVYYSKIYAPEHEYETKALEINGLKLQDGKHPELVVAQINGFMDDEWKEYRIAGWNVQFDYLFLKKLFEMVNLELNCNYNLIDIQSLFSFYYWKITGKFEIKSMRNAYKVLFRSELPISHNAIEDCIFELEILRKLLTELKGSELC